MEFTRRQFLKRSAQWAGIGAGIWLLPAASRPEQGIGKRDRPNVVFLFPDQHRFDWLGFDDRIPVRMPSLHSIARRGMRFTNALSPSPLCAPCRACLAAGKEYDRCGCPSNGTDYPISQTTFYTLLRDSGYWVAGCGKFDLHKATRDWGLDGKRLIKEWGFSDGIDSEGKLDAVSSGAEEPNGPYMAYLHRRGLAQMHVEDFKKRAGIGHAATFPTPLPDDAYSDNWVANNGLELIRNFPRGRPWFLQVNFTGPHGPWDITQRMDALCRDRTFPQPNGSGQYTAEQHVAIRQNYTAMVENIDRWIGIYLDALRTRGELDSTLIVYSSDHGEMLGDRNRWSKSLPWQPSVGVPLIVAGPGTRGGAVCDSPASVMDLAATFLDYAGVARPGDMESRSLKPVLDGKTDAHRDHVLSGLNQWRLVFDGRFKLIRGFNPETPSGKNKKQGKRARAGKAGGGGPVLLFDLKEDPFENMNLADKALAEVERLSKLLG